MERSFKGVWIPKEIWINKNLTLQEKVMLVEIDSLDNNDDGCYASNSYFAEFFGLSNNRISEIINCLSKKGYISLEYIRSENKKNIEKRLIKISRSLYPKMMVVPIRETEYPYSEKRVGVFGKV